jgi:hypothetical protein
MEAIEIVNFQFHVLFPNQRRGSSDARVGGWRWRDDGLWRGNQFCGVGLTEDSSGCVVTGETGLTHTRTKAQFISMIFLMVFGAQPNMCAGSWGPIELVGILPSWPIRGRCGNADRDRVDPPNTHIRPK